MSTNNFLTLVIFLVALGCGSKTSKTPETEIKGKIKNEIAETADTSKLIEKDDFQIEEFKTKELITVEDTVKDHINIDDSIQVIDARHYTYNESEIHSYAFIDFNKHSRFHNYILQQYGCDCLNEELYNSDYNRSFNKFKDSISDNLNVEPIKGDWIPIHKYKGQFYLYHIGCEFNLRGFTISDSTLIKYYMADGPSPSLLLDVDIEEDQYTIKTGYTTYKMKPIKNENIFIVETGNSKKYMIHESAINNYQVIAIDCHELGSAQQIEFDEVDNSTSYN